MEDFPEYYPVCTAWSKEQGTYWWPCIRLAIDDSSYCELHRALVANGSSYVADHRPPNASTEMLAYDPPRGDR